MIFSQTLVWCSFYIPTPSRKTLRLALDEVYHAYHPYNPFAGGTGTPQGAKQLIRLFIAPKNEGWIRVLGEPEESLMEQLAQKLNLPIFLVWVGENAGGILKYGTLDEAILSPLRRSDSVLPLETASANPLEDFAAQQGVNFASADQLIQKTTRNLFQKMGENDKKHQAEGLLPNRFSWQNAPQVLQQVADLRLLPPNWHHPSFEDVSAAYQIAALLEQNPTMPLLSSEEALLDRVAYPLDYIPAYYALT